MASFAGFFSWVLHTSPHELERVVLTASSPEGPWTRELGVTDWVSVVPGPDTAHVILTADRDPAPGLTDPCSALLDLAMGRTRSIGQGIMPAAIPWLQVDLPLAGSWGSRLLVRNRRELVLLDGDGKLEPVHFR